MALTHRKTIIYPPLNDGSRYVVARPKGKITDYRLHVQLLFKVATQMSNFPAGSAEALTVSFLRTELYQLLNWDLQNPNLQEELEALIERLMERKLYQIKPNGQQCSNFFAEIEYDDLSVNLAINPQIIHFLHWQLDYWGRENFTKINFAATHLFTSVYSEIMYNKIINSHENSLTLTIDDFRELVWANAPSYGDIRNLKKKVLQPIINDINNFTEFELSVSQLTQIRRATHLVFSWSSKKG